MDANGNPGLKQKSGEWKTLAILCPRLRHLQIDSENLWGQPDRAPFAKDIITLRGECGSPLKVLAFLNSCLSPEEWLS